MDNAVKLLVVEDNPADSDLIREYLSEITEFKSNLHCVSTLGEAKGYLADNTVHAVLVDLSLPDSRGLQTLREVVNLLKSATAIVLTSLDDKAVALDAMESGAQDYLLKGSLGPETLARVIRYSLQRSKWLSKISEVQEQFYQSQKMESIGRMAGGIAHDFNNQLGAIGLLSELSQDNLPKEHKIQPYLAQIQTVVERAAALTKRLMIFCRIHPFEMCVVEVSELIVANRTLISKLVGESIRLEVQCDPHTTVLGDVGLLEQALMNLVINARDAMDNGGVLTIDVNISETPDKTKVVLIKVSDTGCGMSAETQSRIFEPFFTTKAVGKGTGLGLSMVYGTIKTIGGEITVHSQIGTGTVFTITLPLVEGGDPRPDELVKATELQGQETILLVEDEELLREPLTQVLRGNGYNVFSASNGVEALRLMTDKNVQIDLLISDIVMPEMGGVELGLKMHKLNPKIKIIFSSGYSGENIDGQEIVAGASFLSKPYSSRTLLLKIREVMDGEPHEA